MQSNHLRFFLLCFFLIVLSVVVYQCSKPKAVVDTAYVAQIQKWHNMRVEQLTDENGWLSLAGLFWLKEGRNTFGTDSTNDFMFPKGKAADFMGTFILQNGKVTIDVNPGVNVFFEDQLVTSMELSTDGDEAMTMLTSGSLSWFVVKRGDKFGVRLRDTENEALKAFKDIDTFPIDPAWRVKATFRPYDPPKILHVPTIIGTVNEESCPGQLVFEIAGKMYWLDPIAEPDAQQFFLIFADETNKVETYGAGRFLVADSPGLDGTTFIDFNKAYNPPCAFTPYATCPLPPSQNRLALRVTAGEKMYQSSTDN